MGEFQATFPRLRPRHQQHGCYARKFTKPCFFFVFGPGPGLLIYQQVFMLKASPKAAPRGNQFRNPSKSGIDNTIVSRAKGVAQSHAKAQLKICCDLLLLQQDVFERSIAGRKVDLVLNVF